MSNARGSTRASRKWRRGTKEGGTSICWQNTVRALSEKTTTHFTNEEVKSVVLFKLNKILKTDTRRYVFPSKTL